jgi:hypothetical protein
MARRADCQGEDVTKRLLIAMSLVIGAPVAMADEGGVSFWLPGQMGSFAATPVAPGWSLPLVYYHTHPGGSGGKDFPTGGRITAGLKTSADLVFGLPTYTFHDPVAGGQLGMGLGIAVGSMKASINATVQGPNGNVVSGSETDKDGGNSDLYPLATLKWNQGVNNWLVYTMAGVPIGSYEASALANLGTNHWSWDAGGGYTYLDPKAGYEFSAVAGLTYNFENWDTHYKNGVDAHLDWAASKLIEQWQLGLVGYFYNQLSGDSGSGATLGDFKSRVAGIGPQVGYFFPVGGKKWYANLKGFDEFNENNRAKSWNVWLAVAIPL